MSKPHPNKIYLGDAVYADVSDYGEVILTTEDGIDTTNQIFLEPNVVLALVQWLKLTGMFPRQAGE